MRKKVAVLFGGQSTEHEISRLSAASLLREIDKCKYDIYAIGITKDGQWYEYSGKIEKIEDGSWEQDEYYKYPDGHKLLFNREVDAVFPLLHGLYGEDGTIQGICRLLRLPCIGSGVMSSSICMDKIYTKYLVEKFNIRQTEFIAFDEFEYENKEESILKQIINRLGIELFVKPSNSGSSVGISKVHDVKQLKEAIEYAFKFDRKVLVEKTLNATEVQVALLGNDTVQAAEPGQIISTKEFYDYDEKYIHKEANIRIPADLSLNTIQEIKETAIRIYKLLDCKGMARIDFLLDKDNKVYFNEVNTIPEFRKDALYPKMWQYSGKKYKELIDELIELAMEKNSVL